MDFVPSRKLGLLLGGLLFAAILSAVVLSILQLATAAISAWMILWVTLPLAGVPLALVVVYRLHGLLTARYHMDRDGFSIIWGLSFEQIPMADITGLQLGSELGKAFRPSYGLWWPGCVVGHNTIEGIGKVEFFAISGGDEMVVIRIGERHLAVSPPDPEAFRQAFVAATRMGSLEPIPSRSQRPDFLFNRVWTDKVARVLVLTGLILPLLLLGYLAILAPSLPSEVPFGFDQSGAPEPFAPPGRLLLLPMIGGLCWLTDLMVGAWLYRKGEDHPVSYVMWTVAILVGGLLWGAALQLLSAV